MVALSVTARDLLHRVARDTGLSYSEVARRVNRAMANGEGLLASVSRIVESKGLDPSRYTISPTAVLDEANKILRADYAQTLMISAVLAQMVEAEGDDRLPVPAFFAFLELLNEIPEPQKQSPHESDDVPEIEQHTTRIIELMTTLVSVVCEWSRDGISGISKNCPKEIRPLAKAVFMKTKLFQIGIWSCISCGKMIDVRQTKGLMCPECDASLSPGACRLEPDGPSDFERIGYGRTRPVGPDE